MARGWESKSVEQQQEEATAEKVHRRPLTPAEIEKENRRKGLELARQRILQQLKLASNPKHCEMLQRALADLDRQIEELNQSSPT